MSINIITKDNCSFCVSAKNFLKMKGFDYTETKIGVDISREEFLEKYPWARTVPMIFIDDRFIGGYSELVAEYKD